MFTALPLSPRIVERYSPGAVLTVGLLMSVLGSGVAAAVPTPWVFAGSSAGAALASVSGSLGIGRGDALALAYAGFSAVLAAAAIAATRSLTPEAEKTP